MSVRDDYTTGEQLDHVDWNAAAVKVNTPPTTTISANDVQDTSTRKIPSPQQLLDFAAKAGMTDITNAVTALKASVPSAGDNLLKLYNSIQTLNGLVTGNAPDANLIVDRIQEILQVFATYPEGVDIVQALAGKVATVDVVNDLATTIPGKVADARALKALNDLITGLNAVSQALINKSIDGLANNISNIRASSIYPADTKEVQATAFNVANAALAYENFVFWDDFSDRADSGPGVLGTAIGGGVYTVLGYGLDQGNQPLSRIVSKRWLAVADGVANQTTYAIQSMAERISNIGARFKWIPATFGTDEAVMIFLVSQAGGTAIVGTSVHLRVTRASLSVDFFTGYVSTNVATFTFQTMIPLNREVSANFNFDGNTLRWNVAGNFGTHTDARYGSNIGNFGTWEPFFNSVNGGNSLSIAAVWCKATPWA